MSLSFLVMTVSCMSKTNLDVANAVLIAINNCNSTFRQLFKTCTDVLILIE